MGYDIMQRFCKNERTYACMAHYMSTNLPQECSIFKRKRKHKRSHNKVQQKKPYHWQKDQTKYAQQGAAYAKQKASYPQQQKASYPQQQKASYPQQQKASSPQQQKASYPQ